MSKSHQPNAGHTAGISSRMDFGPQEILPPTHVSTWLAFARSFFLLWPGVENDQSCSCTPGKIAGIISETKGMGL